MIDYLKTPNKIIEKNNVSIKSFLNPEDDNIDWETVDSFGKEWEKFDTFSAKEIEKIGDDYFDILDIKSLGNQPKVLDVGCGSGRWTKYICNKVNFVEAIDPSEAVFTASQFLDSADNVRITHASTDFIPFADDSFDFVFSLGVLHHIPDTARAMKNCVAKVKPGGYFLVYLYYSLDNRGILYKSLFHLSDVIRNVINKLPSSIKVFVCDIIGYLFYFPLARMSKIFKSLFPSSKFPDKLPLSYYSDKSLHIMKNDALDRFGTPLEQRFSKKEIQQMMESSGLEDIVFSNSSPYWHAIGKKPS